MFIHKWYWIMYRSGVGNLCINKISYYIACKKNMLLSYLAAHLIKLLRIKLIFFPSLSSSLDEECVCHLLSWFLWSWCLETWEPRYFNLSAIHQESLSPSLPDCDCCGSCHRNEKAQGVSVSPVHWQ